MTERNKESTMAKLNEEPTMPSRAEVLNVIDQMLTGSLTREDAGLWAGRLHMWDAADPVIEEALDLLSKADCWQTDEEGNFTEYLYDLDGIVAIRKLLLVP